MAEPAPDTALIDGSPDAGAPAGEEPSLMSRAESGVFAALLAARAGREDRKAPTAADALGAAVNAVIAALSGADRPCPVRRLAAGDVAALLERASLPDAVIAADAARRRFILMEPEAVAAFAERLCGGEAGPARRPTAIDRRLLEQALARIGGGPFTALDAAQRAEIAFPPGTDAVSMPLVEARGRGPAPTLHCLALRDESDGAPAAAPDPGVMAARIGAAPVEARVVMVIASKPLMALQRMKAGTVLPLAPDAAASLRIAGAPRLTGRIRFDDDRLGLVIDPAAGGQTKAAGA